MKRFTMLFYVFITVTLLIISANAVIDTSDFVAIYENKFDSAEDIAAFKQMYGTWEVKDGRLWLTDVGNEASALFIYDGESELKSLTDYVVDIDMYNVQTQAGIVIRSDVDAINGGLNGEDFYGYVGYISFAGKKGVLGYGDTDGSYGGNFSVSEDVTAPEANVHLRLAAFGDTVTYYLSDLDSGELLWSASAVDSLWSAGSFGIRLYNKLTEDYRDNLHTSFDNLTVSVRARTYYMVGHDYSYEFGLGDNDEYTLTITNIINLHDFSVLEELSVTADSLQELDELDYAVESGGVISVDAYGTAEASSLTPAEALCEILGEGSFVPTVSNFTAADTITLADGENVVVDASEEVSINATVYTVNLTGIDFEYTDIDTMYVSNMTVSDGTSEDDVINIDGTPRYLYPLSFDIYKSEITGPVSGVLTQLDYDVSSGGNYVYVATDGEYDDKFLVELNTAARYDAESKEVSLLVIKTIERHIHHAGEWVVVTEPTMTKTGLKKRYCESCNQYMSSETIPALGPATYGDYEYIAEDGEVTITKYNGKDVIPDIPSEIDGLPVTKIGERAFYDNLKLEKLIVPSSVKEIGNSAFENCCDIYSIELPEGLLTIGDKAFSGCFDGDVVNGGFVDLPESVTYIGSYAFADCRGIRYIDMPDSLTEFGIGLFYNCAELNEIIFPEGLLAIGDGTFFAPVGMGLDRLYIPKSVKEIKNSAFLKENEIGVTLYEVYYGGSAEDFLSIRFEDGNTNLINSDIVFGASAYSFNSNGGEYISPIISTDGIAEMPVATKDGYDFEGWYDNAALSGEKVTFPYKKEGTVTLYAKWALTADVDGDGGITLKDALTAIDFLLSREYNSDSDVNGDGKLSLVDVLLIIKRI